MRLRILASFLALFAATAVAAPAPAVPSGPEQFQVAQKTEVPNTTLQPGSYSIRILDHLRDRVILQVSKAGHVESTFLAIPAATMASAPVGPIPYTAGPKGKSALKGFAFPGGVAVEFVYPKDDAVSIAQANDTRVMAIDPASEGRVPAANLKQNDMEMITLWMLEPARVGAADAKPSIAASRYQAPAPAAAAAPVQTAQAEPAPAAAPAPDATPAADNTAAAPSSRPARHRSQPVQLAQNDAPAPLPARPHTRPAGVKALPHTGSNLPWLWLGMFGCFGLAGALRLHRLTVRA